MERYSDFCKKRLLEKVFRFSRESGVDSNLLSLLSFGTSHVPSAGVAHFQRCLHYQLNSASTQDVKVQVLLCYPPRSQKCLKDQHICSGMNEKSYQTSAFLQKQGALYYVLINE